MKTMILTLLNVEVLKFVRKGSRFIAKMGRSFWVVVFYNEKKKMMMMKKKKKKKKKKKEE